MKIENFTKTRESRETTQVWGDVLSRKHFVMLLRPLTTKNKNRANYCNILSEGCHDRLSIGRLNEWVCIVSAMHSNWLHLLLVAVRYWSGQTRVSHYSASNCGLSGSVDSVLQQSDNLCAREWVCACFVGQIGSSVTDCGSKWVFIYSRMSVPQPEWQRNKSG